MEKPAPTEAPTMKKSKKMMKEVEKFIDQEFPPETSSLYKDFNSIDEPLKALWSTIVFKDIDRIYQQPIKVFDRVSPNDILQGNLGDCYFLSALSALAEFPQRIVNCFDTQDYQESGKYTVKLFDLGMRTTITVDDYFPCTTEGKIAFSGPKIENNVTELWVLLLEKAWAKRFGSYWAIDKGAIEDVLRDLTSAPCENFQMDDKKLWHKIHSANRKNFIITAARLKDENDEDSEVNDKGLVNFHAYAVIDARKIKGKRGRENLIKIRNPWAKVEWNGDWSDKSELWTDELKEKLGWTNEDDGSFWMNFEDFSRNYHRVTVCRVQDEFFYNSVLARQDSDKASVFRVKVLDGGSTYFMVTFEDSRKLGRGLEYGDVRIIIARKEPEGLQRVAGLTTSNYRDSWVLINAHPGEYVVYVKVQMETTLSDKYGFSVYSASQVEIKEVSDRFQDYWQRVYTVDLAKQLGHKTEVKEGIFYYQTVFDQESIEDICQSEGVYLDAFENLSEQECVLQIVHTDFRNLEIFGDSNSKSSYDVRLEPKQNLKVIKYKKKFSEPSSALIKIDKV